MRHAVDATQRDIAAPFVSTKTGKTTMRFVGGAVLRMRKELLGVGEAMVALVLRRRKVIKTHAHMKAPIRHRSTSVTRLPKTHLHILIIKEYIAGHYDLPLQFSCTLER